MTVADFKKKLQILDSLLTETKVARRQAEDVGADWEARLQRRENQGREQAQDLTRRFGALRRDI